MNIVSARIVFQIFFFGLFTFLAFVTEFSYLAGYPVSIFLEADPLVAIATAVSTHSLYRGLLWALVLLLPTLLLGRFFCNWICPYGSLHQFVGWFTDRKSQQQKIDGNRYRPLYALKYYILIAMVVAAAFGSLQIGLLDPISMLVRSFTVSVWPSLDLATGWLTRPRAHQWGWVIGFLFLFVLSMNLVIPRFFCRALCPLGATLGVLSRFSLWRIDQALSRKENRQGSSFRDTFVSHFHITTSGNFSDPALLCCVMEMGVDRIMFSVDYPFVENQPGVDWIEKVSLSREDREKILNGNATRLLGL